MNLHSTNYKITEHDDVRVQYCICVVYIIR